MPDLKWSDPAETVEDVPKDEGYYWVTFPGSIGSMVMKYETLEWWVCGDDRGDIPVELIGCRFYGPIPEPEESE